ncbi:hypothetical protein [Sphaerisporangium flaviroseum]
MRRRARRQASRVGSAPWGRRRRLTGWERRKIARRAREDAAQSRSTWREWGPLTAIVIGGSELAYFFLIAANTGGPSVAGVAVTAAFGFVSLSYDWMRRYLAYTSIDPREFPLRVVGVVSVAVMLVTIVVATLWDVI